MVSPIENNNATERSTETAAEIVIDYKDAKYLSRFVSDRGKMIPSRVSGIQMKTQREIAKAIKRARILAIMPFISNK